MMMCKLLQLSPPVSIRQPISSLAPVIEFRQMQQDAKRLGSDWLLIDQLLDDGVALDTNVPNLPAVGSSIRKLSLAWTNPLFIDPGVQMPGPVHEKLMHVAHVAVLDRADVVKALTDPQESFPVRACGVATTFGTRHALACR